MHRSVPIGIVALLLALPPAWSAAPPKRRTAKVELEALAVKLPFFRPWDFARDNDYHHDLPQKVSAEYQKALLPLRGRAYREADLIPLLAHRDPRVRTLAAAGLFAHENPRSLLRLKPLLGQKTLTFLQPAQRFGLFMTEEMPELEEQTVGDVARCFVEGYLDTAGHQLGERSPKETEKALDAYWALRRDRAFCASWFGVRLYRASQGSSPTSKSRSREVASVRADVDRLGGVDRGLTLLWLSAGTGGEALVSEKDLVAGCKEIGRDRLLDLLRRKTVSTDPDLDPARNERLRPMMLFVLRHAGELFRPRDADAILDCMNARGNSSWPEWYIAAASAEPKRAQEILDKGWKAKEGSNYSFDKQARIQLTFARWRLVRDEGTALVVKRFYADEPEWAAFPTGRAHFLAQLGETWEARDRQLLVALVRDKQFDTLEWQSLTRLVRLVNQVEKKAIIGEDDLRKAWHPLGMGHAEWPAMNAEKKYPKETAELQKHLRNWRATLRRHLVK